jgi:CubicO group peptidase (beta-lactamase class C family)
MTFGIDIQADRLLIPVDSAVTLEHQNEGPRVQTNDRVTRRNFLLAAPGVGFTTALAGCAAGLDERWGEKQGFPTGWGPAGQQPRWEGYTQYRVGNYSGGFEGMFKHNVLRAGTEVSPLVETPKPPISPSSSSISAYLDRWPVTSLLIARDGRVSAEHYRFQRTANTRMTSWSMAKSVTSLLFGIALNEGLIHSVDDTPDIYVPQLRATLLGSIKFRHLLNMSSGAAVVHERDWYRIDVPALLGPVTARTIGTDVDGVVRTWTDKQEEPGRRFNYTELCPLTIGMTLRAVSGMSLAAYAEKKLWMPMGAEANATWLTDERGREYNCVGFAARTRDWARLAQLIAQRGETSGRQVVPASWIENCATHGPEDQQVNYGSAQANWGYKNFFWHPRPNGMWLMMRGHHGQTVLVDRPSRTVVVQTAVSEDGPWLQDLFSIFQAAIAA